MSDQVDVMAGSVPLQGSFDGSHMIGIPATAISGGVIQSVNGDSTSAQVVAPSDGIAVTSVGALHTIGLLPPNDANVWLPVPPEPGFSFNTGVVTPNFTVADKILGVRSFLVRRAFSAIALPKIAFNVITGALGKRVGFAIYSADGNTLITDGSDAIGATGLHDVILSNPVPDPGQDYLFCWTSDSTVAVLDFISSAISALSSALANQIIFEAANPGISGGFPAALGALSATTDLVPAGIIHL